MTGPVTPTPMSDQEKWDRLLAAIKWLLGAIAVVAVFLLASPDANLPVAVKIALGAYLAFAAYANPATLVRATAPELTARADAEKRAALEAAVAKDEDV